MKNFKKILVMIALMQSFSAEAGWFESMSQVVLKSISYKTAINDHKYPTSALLVGIAALGVVIWNAPKFLSSKKSLPAIGSDESSNIEEVKDSEKTTFWQDVTGKTGAELERVEVVIPTVHGQRGAECGYHALKNSLCLVQAYLNKDKSDNTAKWIDEMNGSVYGELYAMWTHVISSYREEGDTDWLSGGEVDLVMNDMDTKADSITLRNANWIPIAKLSDYVTVVDKFGETFGLCSDVDLERTSVERLHQFKTLSGQDSFVHSFVVNTSALDPGVTVNTSTHWVSYVIVRHEGITKLFYMDSMHANRSVLNKAFSKLVVMTPQDWEKRIQARNAITMKNLSDDIAFQAKVLNPETIHEYGYQGFLEFHNSDIKSDMYSKIKYFFGIKSSQYIEELESFHKRFVINQIDLDATKKVEHYNFNDLMASFKVSLPGTLRDGNKCRFAFYFNKTRNQWYVICSQVNERAASHNFIIESEDSLYVNGDVNRRMSLNILDPIRRIFAIIFDDGLKFGVSESTAGLKDFDRWTPEVCKIIMLTMGDITAKIKDVSLSVEDLSAIMDNIVLVLKKLEAMDFIKFDSLTGKVVFCNTTTDSLIAARDYLQDFISQSEEALKAASHSDNLFVK